MSRDVGFWAKSCIPCQKSKISTLVHSPVPSIPVQTLRFSHVHIDIVGPLPSSQSYSYLLTMFDLNHKMVLSSQPGYQGLEGLQFSHQTEVPSSHLQFGLVLSSP